MADRPKNAFEELIESLRASTEKLRAVAAQMRASVALTEANTQRFKRLNEALKAWLETMKRQQTAMDSAKASLEKLGNRVRTPSVPPKPAPSVTKPAPKPPVTGFPSGKDGGYRN